MARPGQELLDPLDGHRIVFRRTAADTGGAAGGGPRLCVTRAGSVTTMASAPRLAAALLPAFALVLGCGGGDDAVDLGPARAYRQHTVYWLGPSFAGLPLTATPSAKSLIYGDCEVPRGFDPGGCAPPLEVQNASLDARNPLTLDILPTELLTVRGVPAARYRGDGIEVYTGDTTVVILGGADLALRAVAALRPVRSAAARPGALPPPRWPAAFERELCETVAAARGPAGARGARRRLGISQRAIRFRVRLARMLGPGAETCA